MRGERVVSDELAQCSEPGHPDGEGRGLFGRGEVCLGVQRQELTEALRRADPALQFEYARRALLALLSDAPAGHLRRCGCAGAESIPSIGRPPRSLLRKRPARCGFAAVETHDLGRC